MFVNFLSKAHCTWTFLTFFQIFLAFLEVCLKCFHLTVILLFVAVGFCIAGFLEMVIFFTGVVLILAMVSVLVSPQTVQVYVLMPVEVVVAALVTFPESHLWV